MKKQNDTVSRSLIKTVTYRVSIIITTFVISFMVTGNLILALGITSISSVTNTLIYYFHERLWNVVKWGKRG